MKIKFIILVSLACSLLIGCQKTQTSIPSTKNLSPYEVAGLSVDLPFTLDLDRNISQLPAAARARIKSVATYTGGEGGFKIAVSNVVYKAPEASLDVAANGAVNQVRANSDVSSFSSSIEPVEVSGLEGRNVTLNYRNSGHSIIHYALVFVRRNELWSILIIETESRDHSQLEELKKKIFESVKVL